MTVDIGPLDRFVRLTLGLVLIMLPLASGAAVFAMTWINYVSIAGAIVILVTAATQFCVIYRIFGIQTCKER
ncbi:DUF2892 domain-containing protein [Yoonia sp.]|uniref:YgaP family membrane protein n=1 Tax=Yoonia sp. TaxID=2212373 RepID=UPI0025E2EDB3|nr:DUF2892 domain-containing protein [Yoonia sp.]